MPVTSYITKAEYQAFAGITTLTPVLDAQLDFILPAVKSSIDNILGNLELEERTIKVNFRNAVITRGVRKIYTYNLNITDVISINGVNVQDFKTDGRLNNIILAEIGEDTQLDEYPEIDIVISNGWIVAGSNPTPNLPSDIKLLSCLMVKDSLTQIGGGNITKKKIGDKELGFSSNTSDNIQSMITNILSLYKLYHV